MAHNETTCSACNLNDGYFVSDSTLESHLRSVFDPFAADDHDHGLCEDHLDHARFVAEYDENMHELETGEVRATPTCRTCPPAKTKRTSPS